MQEKLFVEINGLRQGMVIQSEDTQNPVLLFLHGGPGSPEVAFSQQFPTGMEKLFTVCWWEQRGSGITYSRRIPKETMTMEQMIADTLAVADYLRKRFGKEKVYLMGHSWGSVLGICTVQKAPERFYAYIGLGQVVRQDESERLAYRYMLDEFWARGDKKMLAKLKKHPIDKGAPIGMKYLGVRSVGMMKLGIGIMHNMHSVGECVKMVLGYKGYTLVEKLKYPMGSSFCMKYFWDFVMGTDFCQQVPRLEIPVYIFQGQYDYQVSYQLAKEYTQKLCAPVKGFYTFSDSAHSPCFEEPEKFCQLLQQDVLAGKIDGADLLPPIEA